MEDDSVHLFYGTVVVSAETSLPCLVSIIRTNDESDWLDIAIPQAIFEKLYPYQYPLTKQLIPLLQQIEDALIQLAEYIHNEAPFDLAMIGEEVSGYTNHRDITAEQLKNITCLGPASLQKRLEVRGKQLSNQLVLLLHSPL